MDSLLKAARAKKRKDFDVFCLPEPLFQVIAGGVFGLAFDSVLDLFLRTLPLIIRVEIEIAVVAVSVAACVFLYRKKNLSVSPYERDDSFEFLGLYNLRDAGSIEGNDVINREKEAAHIRQTLEDVVFPQRQSKQAICLIGASGCGKSTILSFFRAQYESEYSIVDLTDNYLDFRLLLEKRFGSGPVVEVVAKAATAKKVVFVLDQFERFFYLPEYHKEDVRALIKAISMKNTGIILSMREEYLADFMKEFDVNDLRKSGRDQRRNGGAGIVNDLISTISVLQKGLRVGRGGVSSRLFDEWGGVKVKANHSTHLERIGAKLEDKVIDRPGNTIFYCENQNDRHTRDNASDKMRTKVEKVLGAGCTDVYERHKHEPLIEQQIILHMIEHEKKRRRAPQELVRELSKMDDYDLLNRYFAIQLAATGDYFNASRILYLLSSARLNHVVMQTSELEFGMLVGHFSKSEHVKFQETLEELERIQLVRRDTENSDNEFEIAHDFIARAYLSYSNVNLDRNVREALDIYMSEYLDDDGKRSVERKHERFSTARQSKFFSISTAIGAIAIVVAFIIVNFVANPWDGALSSMDVFGGLQPWFPLFGCELSLLYSFAVNSNIYRYCHGIKPLLSKIGHCTTLFGSILGVVLYPHSMFIMGAFLAMLGVSCAIGLDDLYQESSKRELRLHGLRCVLMGSVYAVFHIVVCAFAPVFPVYIVFIEFMMILVLVGYSWLSHINKGFLFARAIDAGSMRVLD